MENLILTNKIDSMVYNSTDFQSFVEELKLKYLSLWWQCETCCPKIKTNISFLEKLANERKMECFRKGLRKELKQIPEGEIKREDLHMSILGLI